MKKLKITLLVFIAATLCMPVQSEDWSELTQEEKLERSRDAYEKEIDNHRSEGSNNNRLVLHTNPCREGALNVQIADKLFKFPSKIINDPQYRSSCIEGKPFIKLENLHLKMLPPSCEQKCASKTIYVKILAPSPENMPLPNQQDIENFKRDCVRQSEEPNLDQTVWGGSCKWAFSHGSIDYRIKYWNAEYPASQINQTEQLVADFIEQYETTQEEKLERSRDALTSKIYSEK